MARTQQTEFPTGPRLGKEIACCWEINLAAVRADFGNAQLQETYSEPDDRGCRKVTLRPLLKGDQ